VTWCAASGGPCERGVEVPRVREVLGAVGGMLLRLRSVAATFNRRTWDRVP
jgi:hypothetical protein